MLVEGPMQIVLIIAVVAIAGLGLLKLSQFRYGNPG
jgi:hypothetical protein